MKKNLFLLLCSFLFASCLIYSMDYGPNVKLGTSYDQDQSKISLQEVALNNVARMVLERESKKNFLKSPDFFKRFPLPNVLTTMVAKKIMKLNLSLEKKLLANIFIPCSILGNPTNEEDDPNEAWSVSFNKDGNKIVSGYEDGSVKIWDVTSKVCERSFYGHNDTVYSVEFNKTGKKIVSSSDDDTVMIWDVTSNQPQTIIDGHTGQVFSASFNKTDDQILSSSTDNTVRIWDIKSNKCLQKIEMPQNFFGPATFNEEEDKIVIAGSDGTIQVWDKKTGTCELSLKGDNKQVTTAKFNKKGDKIVSADQGGVIRIWNLQSGLCDRVIYDHTDDVNTAVFNKTEDKILSASDHSVKIWDVQSGQCDFSFTWIHELIGAAAWNETENKIVLAMGDGTVRILDLSGFLSQQNFIENKLNLEQVLLLVCWNDAIIHNRKFGISKKSHLQNIFDSIDNEGIREMVLPNKLCIRAPLTCKSVLKK